jgi:hypothetical protein
MLFWRYPMAALKEIVDLSDAQGTRFVDAYHLTKLIQGS